MQLIKSAAASLPLLSALPRLRVDLPPSHRGTFARLEHCSLPVSRTGATLKEIMSRLGQSSARAAMIYQHATSERDREIAQALDLMIAETRAAAGEAAEEQRDQGDEGGPTLAPVA